MMKGKKYAIVLDFIGNYVKAYKVKEWIGDIIPSKEAEFYCKPEYKLNVPYVYFDAQVIDLFERQDWANIPKERLIENYFEVKKKVGRVPSQREMVRYGKYHFISYQAVWGLWSKFLNFMGDRPQQRPNKKYNKKECVDYYYQLKKTLNRQPRFSDFHRFAVNDLVKRKEKQKILIVTTDATGIEVPERLKESIEIAKENNIEVVGIGIQSEEMQDYFDKYILINDLTNFSKQMLELLRDVIKR